jgi:hypothetical protein
MINKIGVTIGIGYQGTKVNALTGTVNDSLNVTKALTSKYGYNITNLNDKNYSKTNAKYPSKKNIIFWLSKLLREAKDGDELFIGYAGHGIQLQANSSNKEEVDLKDEAIIPADYNFDDKTAIIDDEISNLITMGLNNKPNCKLFILFDCCHSGTAADLRYTFNYHHSKRDFTYSDSKNTNNFKSKVILLSGCRDDQVSWEDLISLSGGGKSRQGVMSSAFIHVISRNPKSMSNIFEIVKEMYVFTSPYKQQPQISCNYDISKDTNSGLRSVIKYDNEKPIIAIAKPTPNVANPTQIIKPTPINTITKPVVIKTKPNTKPNQSTSNMYGSGNRYRYRYRNRYRNRYDTKNSYKNKYNYRYRKYDNNESDIKYNAYTTGIPFRSASRVVQMNDILGMVV